MKQNLMRKAKFKSYSHIAKWQNLERNLKKRAGKLGSQKASVRAFVQEIKS